MFEKILIANRGEIACRIASTCQRMGIRTVAVYSDADRHAQHVRACNEAVHLGGAVASESYLHIERILQAARLTGAQAIHPGYGFLSENAAFARACEASDTVFIGPASSTIETMGSKSAAKQRMARAGVSLVPGYHGDDQSVATLRAQAQAITYPVLIKASAGGGGKGMRIVDDDVQFEAALLSCQREARQSFGDDRVLIERYLQRPRHVEVQILADRYGHVLALFDRDCSVQRRHQKVLEEAPAPGLKSSMRMAMAHAAIQAAQAVNYRGAGTIEFIVASDGTFYFMEMNTRLQVEHPVTEAITGLDLVEWQCRIAAGEPLPFDQQSLRQTGHAIEARLYAEDPAHGFLPSSGHLTHWRLPCATAFTWHQSSSVRKSGEKSEVGRARVRIDCGVREGDTISPYYDPMLGKLIVHADDRPSALAAMKQALRECELIGLRSNIGFLQRLVAHPTFVAAELDTGLIERHRADLIGHAQAAGDAVTSALAFACAAYLSRAEGDAASTEHAAASPWDAPGLAYWRIGVRYRQQLAWRWHQSGRVDPVRNAAAGALTVGDTTLEATTFETTLTSLRGTQFEFALSGEHLPMSWTIKACSAGASITLQQGALTTSANVVRDGNVFTVFHHLGVCCFEAVDRLRDLRRGTAAGSDALTDGLRAPMPGKVIALHVGVGDAVVAGAPLAVLEAMKMEHTINAPVNGVITELWVTMGRQVEEGTVLLSIAPEA